MACAWLEDLFYEKCGCPSSYDVEAGGTMSRKVAISKELLPADNDAEYMDYYQEQMAKVKEMFAAEQKAAKKQEFIDKNGFDPDDPDIIDVTPIGEEPAALPGKGTSAVEQSAGTAVGMPKNIFYGAVFHANGFGMKLGYDKKVWTLSQGNTTVDQLGFGNAAANQLTEKDEEDMIKDAEKVNEDANYYGNFAQIYSALRGIEKAIRDSHANIPSGVSEAVLSECDAIRAECEKCGNPECKDGEIRGLKETELSQDDVDDIADMFAGYSAGGLSTAGRSQLMGFMSMHGDELKKLARQASQANGLGDMAYARDLGNDDLDESENKDGEVSETEREINEIIGEEDDSSDTEKAIDEYAKIEDEAEEDDEMLSESVIRHANMLAREVW